MLEDGRTAMACLRWLAGTAGGALTIRDVLEPEKGALALSLVSPEGKAIWTRSATEPALGGATVPLPECGPYRVEVAGDGSRGSFTVDDRVGAPAGR